MPPDGRLRTDRGARAGLIRAFALALVAATLALAACGTAERTVVSRWASFGLILTVLAAVGVIAMRFVGCVPRTERATPATLALGTALAGAIGGGGSAPLTSAVQRATEDKARFGAASKALARFTEPGYGRRMFWRGALGGVAWVLALGFAVGFVTAGEWGMLASLLLLLAVIIAYLAATLLTDNLTNVVHIRALFALGVSTGFILGAVIGSVCSIPSSSGTGCVGSSDGSDGRRHRRFGLSTYLARHSGADC